MLVAWAAIGAGSLALAELIYVVVRWLLRH